MRSDQTRLDPDALIEMIAADDRGRHGGQLRVFLGMSAGVGKTFAMLRAAQQKRAEGVDVVIGLVETHSRKETAALLEGLELVERKQTDYRGTALAEMDIDAILARKPKLVIVDELAHTNIPGSRHHKRYQDVLEILDAGIDVYTAVNVQHLESRKDAVEAITGIQIRETVPDSMLERAALVELVDIAPTELLKRLSEGKVYLGEQAAKAADGFFKESKLTALREIALRMTAERVDQDLQRLSVTKTDRAWQTNERLLVAVSHSPYSEHLIRATRRLAYNLEAPWIAVHIDTGLSLNDTDQAQLMKNLTLARELRAEVITTTDTDLPTALKRLCRQKNVTQVVTGRPTRRWFRDLLEGGSLLSRLVNEANDVDIHVIRQERATIARRPSIWTELSLYRTRSGFGKYVTTFWIFVGLTIAAAAAEPLVGYRAVGFFFLLGVLGVGAVGSLGTVLLAAFLSASIWNFGFIPPRFTIRITQPEDMILCAAYFVVALITGFLTNRIRFQERLMRDREERTRVLYRVGQDILQSSDKKEFIAKVTERVGLVLKAKCGVILANRDGALDFSQALERGTELSEKEQAVAQWSFQNQKPAGWATDTLSESASQYLPLRGVSERVGVFIFLPERRTRKLGLDQETLLGSIVGQLGFSIERHFLSRRLLENQRLQDSEQLQQTLLNSISHEMRTPLTAILGSAAALSSQAMGSQDSQLQSIAQSLSEAGERLNRVIENLLDMSRLNSGVLALNTEWNDLGDLASTVRKKISGIIGEQTLSFNIATDVGLVRLDFRLFEHAVSNLVLNAVQYAGSKAKINVSARVIGGRHVELRVEDDGPGLPAESIPHIFEKFYRVPGSPPGGTGLGLSIVQSIVELHKGSIRFENVSPHGAAFVIELPLDEQPPHPGEVDRETQLAVSSKVTS